jgi:hypothetical protein
VSETPWEGGALGEERQGESGESRVGEA